MEIIFRNLPQNKVLETPHAFFHAAPARLAARACRRAFLVEEARASWVPLMTTLGDPLGRGGESPTLSELRRQHSSVHACPTTRTLGFIKLLCLAKGSANRHPPILTLRRLKNAQVQRAATPASGTRLLAPGSVFPAICREPHSAGLRPSTLWPRSSPLVCRPVDPLAWHVTSRALVLACKHAASRSSPLATLGPAHRHPVLRVVRSQVLGTRTSGDFFVPSVHSLLASLVCIILAPVFSFCATLLALPGVCVCVCVRVCGGRPELPRAPQGPSASPGHLRAPVLCLCVCVCACVCVRDCA